MVECDSEINRCEKKSNLTNFLFFYITFVNYIIFFLKKAIIWNRIFDRKFRFENFYSSR